MTEKENDEKSFKVEDRRTSSGEKADSPQEAEPEEKREIDPQEEGEEAQGESQDKGVGDGGPQVDFSTFIFSLFSSALIQMGDMADPITGKMEKNIQAAKQTIDIIDILARKTEGNLSDEESNLLKNASAELKWKYIDAVKGKG
jgi:hypothetical protein